jgi:hypothetical protein
VMDRPSPQSPHCSSRCATSRSLTRRASAAPMCCGGST